LEKDKKRSKKKYYDPQVVTHYARNPTFFPCFLLHRPGVRVCVPRIFPAFCSCPNRFPLFPCKKKESRDTTKKKRESLKKEKKKNKRTGHGRNTQIGSVATPAKTVWATVCPVHPRVHPSFLFFSLPFLLFHSFLFLAPVISNI
jgi:hypothetical protein